MIFSWIFSHEYWDSSQNRVQKEIIFWILNILKSKTCVITYKSIFLVPTKNIYMKKFNNLLFFSQPYRLNHWLLSFGGILQFIRTIQSGPVGPDLKNQKNYRLILVGSLKSRKSKQTRTASFLVLKLKRSYCNSFTLSSSLSNPIRALVKSLRLETWHRRRRAQSKMLTADIPPNQSIYIKNLNEKIKKEGKFSLFSIEFV